MKPFILYIVACVMAAGTGMGIAAYLQPPRAPRPYINDHTVQGKGSTIVLDGVHYHVFFARGVDGDHVDIEVIRVTPERETP
jgi:hypothetical protein